MTNGFHISHIITANTAMKSAAMAVGIIQRPFSYQTVNRYDDEQE